VLLAALACGSEPPGPPIEPDKSLLPVALGNRWTYRVTSTTGVPSTKIQTVTATIASADGTIYVMETERAEMRGTRSRQRVVDGQLQRISEEGLEGGVVTSRFRFEPAGLRIDSNRRTKGDSYTDSHTKIEIDEMGNTVQLFPKTHTFTIESGSELVTVAAGTFECVRVLRRRQDGNEKRYWYAPGLGKVKEVGLQVEELEKAELK